MLYLRNWIRSGIRNITDLRFRHGTLDVNYLYQKICHSNSIWQEIFLLQNALFPYRENLLNDINVPNLNAHKFEPQSCKEVYCLSKTNITSSIPQLTHYLTKYISDNRTTDDIVSHIYLNKISLVKEIYARSLTA